MHISAASLSSHELLELCEDSPVGLRPAGLGKQISARSRCGPFTIQKLSAWFLCMGESIAPAKQSKDKHNGNLLVVVSHSEPVAFSNTVPGASALPEDCSKEHQCSTEGSSE